VTPRAAKKAKGDQEGTGVEAAEVMVAAMGEAAGEAATVAKEAAAV
jgi:hypothetical protein